MTQTDYVAADEMRCVVLARDLLLRLAGGLSDPTLLRTTLDAVTELQKDCGSRVNIDK